MKQQFTNAASLDQQRAEKSCTVLTKASSRVGSGERRSSVPWWNSHLAEGVWAAVGLPQRLASFTAHAHRR